jgi:hypothetical protein
MGPGEVVRIGVERVAVEVLTCPSVTVGEYACAWGGTLTRGLVSGTGYGLFRRAEVIELRCAMAWQRV